VCFPAISRSGKEFAYLLAAAVFHVVVKDWVKNLETYYLTTQLHRVIVLTIYSLHHYVSVARE
jgi:hypothetical protein